MASEHSWYLNSIGRVPLLTPAQEIELGTAVQAWLTHPDGPDNAPPAIRRRGRRAKDRFVESNLRLVVNYVSEKCFRLAKRGEFMDLVQAGNLGLIRAVERFDPTRGYKFSTYAFWWIRQSVNRYIDTSSRLIQISGVQSQKLMALSAVTRRLFAELRREPTPSELAEALGMSLASFEQMIRLSQRIVSIDAVMTEDGSTMAEMLAASPAPEAIPPDLEAFISSKLERLTSRSRELLSARFGIGRDPVPVEAMALEAGLTLGRLNRQVGLALLELRAHCQASGVPHAPPAGSSVSGEAEQLSLINAAVVASTRQRGRPARRRRARPRSPARGYSASLNG